MRRGSSSGERREGETDMAALENRSSSRPPLRSQSSDMGDVVGLVKDMAKFLDRLQYENLSEDSEQVREGSIDMREKSESNPYCQVRSSMSARIEFVLRSFPTSRHSSVASLDLPPPPPSLLAPPLPLSPPPPHSLNSSASSSHMSISMEDSRVVEEDDEFQYEEEDECYENSGMHQTTTTAAPPLSTAGPPLPSRAPRPSGLGVSEVVDGQKVDQVQPTLEFQPQETSTPHTTPRKSFSKTIDRSVGPPPLMMSMDTDPDTSAEAGDDTIDEDPLYDSMVNESEPKSPISVKTDPINSAAKVKQILFKCP